MIKFNFKRNPRTWVYLENYQYQLKEDEDLMELLFPNCDQIINQIGVLDLLKRLESDYIQEHCIKILTDYDSIPQDLVEHYRELVNRFEGFWLFKEEDSPHNNPFFAETLKNITDYQIKTAIINALAGYYNRCSLFHIDVMDVVIRGWKNNRLTDSEPRSVILEEIERVICQKCNILYKERPKCGIYHPLNMKDFPESYYIDYIENRQSQRKLSPVLGYWYLLQRFSRVLHP